MRGVRKALFWGLAILCIPRYVHASDIKAFQSHGASFITVSGDFEPGDEKKFKDVAFDKDVAIVVLQSNGGDLRAGIEIGRAIRFKSFATYIPEGVPCASACALAWLGGMPRFVDTGSRIGFHAAYILRNGEASESGAGNAMVGAYMNQLELSEKAIVYLTEAPPDGMQWLTASDAYRYGIAVTLLNSSETNEISSSTSQHEEKSAVQVDPSSATDAQRYLQGLIGQWSQPDLDIKKYVSDAYAENVSYYGKQFSNAEIYADKSNFAKRWDKRSYVVEPNTMQFDCIDETTCHASFIVSFKAYSTKAAKSSSGEAWNVISMQKFSTGWRITQETGEVINRHP